MTEFRLLDQTELTLVSGGYGLAMPLRIIREALCKANNHLTSEPVPPIGDPENPPPKSASFDPVTVKF